MYLPVDSADTQLFIISIGLKDVYCELVWILMQVGNHRGDKHSGRDLNHGHSVIHDASGHILTMVPISMKVYAVGKDTLTGI